jgi:parallel beta-helix repeat protein
LSPLVLSTRATHRRVRQRARWLAALTVVGVATGCLIVGGQANGSTTSWDVVVNDSFARTVDSGWGSAEQGGSWSVRSDSGSGFSVASGGGLVVVDPGRSAEATVLGSAVGDAQAQTTFTLPSVTATGYGVYETVQIRRQDNGDAYRARVRVASGGHAVLSLVRWSGKTETGLTSNLLPFVVRSGMKTNLRVQVIGTSPVTLEAKAWPQGAAEPDWQSTVSDSSTARLTSAGSVGLWTYVSGAAGRTTVLTNQFTASKATATDPTTSSPAPPSTTSPVPAPVTPTTGAIGSAAVGSTAYAIPSNALYVSASSGRDGNSGSVSSPMQTIGAGVAHAANGQTVVVRQGSYNEHLNLGKPITIQAYPHEAVWMDGSVPVSGWTQSGATWVAPWSYQFNHSTDNAGNSSSRFVDPAYPMAAWSDQVFLDGSSMRQVQSADAVGDGTFFVDYGNRTLRIGSSPSGHEVRASNEAQAIYSTATDVVLQGFGVRRYATELADSGAVRIGNARSTVSNLVITDNATQGLSMRNTDNMADHVTVTHNGMLGIGANAAYNFTVTNSEVTSNNSEHFKVAPLSGGVKITRSRDVSMRNNDVSNNWSAGIWLDESCYAVNITGNTANNNSTTGIQLELSDTAIVADNEVVGNQTGVQIIDSGNVRVFNNEFGRSSSFSLRLKQDTRRASNTSLTGHDPQRPNPDPTIPWIVRNITISNNLFGAGGLYQIYAMDNVTNLSADAMLITINGNVFNRFIAKGQTKMVGWGGSNNSSVTTFDTPEALAAGENSGWRNAGVNPPTDISSMGAAKTTYVSIAVGLPSDIASLLDQPAGVRRLGLF